MYENQLKELVSISRFAGNRVDYTQGGGGNTSVKLDNKLMAIKASGYKLSEITLDNAYVTVDYEKVKDYYENVDISQNKDFEKESNSIVKDSISLLPDMKNLRPSVEVGFHAILDKYVIHIHSVYAAIIVCSKNGEDIMNKILKDKDYGFIFVPYINPGFSLSVEILNKITEYKKANGKNPEAIFMKNHGLVVHCDNPKRAMDIIKDINEEIMKYFDISPLEFNEIKFDNSQGIVTSKTPVLVNFLKENKLDKDLLDKYPLYPDQLVYLNNNIANTPDKINFEETRVYYKNVTLNEVVTLEETLCAFIFVISKIKENNLPISLMSQKDVDFINNWEAEKFRRSLNK